VLFTTYKLATGSMFRKMENQLRGKAEPPVARIRSKNRDLEPDHLKVLETLIAD
jgi:hypothetical protein